jgi:hypothetical protein
VVRARYSTTIRSSTAVTPGADQTAAIASAPRVEQSQETATDLLLDGFAAWGQQHYEAGVELLRPAITPLTADQRWVSGPTSASSRQRS